MEVNVQPGAKRGQALAHERVEARHELLQDVQAVLRHPPLGGGADVKVRGHLGRAHFRVLLS